jgi:potassium efflux system protein
MTRLPSTGAALRMLAALVLVVSIGAGAPMAQNNPAPDPGAADSAQAGEEAAAADLDAQAQTDGATDAAGDEPAAIVPAPLDAAMERQLGTWRLVLDRIVEQLAAEDLTLAQLAAIRDQVDRLRTDVTAFTDGLRAQLEGERTLLQSAVGAETEATEGAAVESQQVRDLRQNIVDLEAQLQPAELILARAQALRDQVTARRAEVFAGRLFERAPSILAPEFWSRGLPGIGPMLVTFERQIERSVTAVRERATPIVLTGLAGVLVLLLVLAIPLRGLALRRGRRNADAAPSDMQRIIGALRIVLLSAGIPALGFLLLMTATDAVGGLTRQGRLILEAVALNTTLYFLISGLARAFLAPGLPSWRLVPLGETYASRAAVFVRLAGLVYAIGEATRSIGTILVTPLATFQLVQSLFALVVAICVLGLVRALLRGLESPAVDGPTPIVQVLWRWTVPIAGLIALATLVALLLGYLALGAFLIDRLAWTAVVLAGLHLIVVLLETLAASAFQEGSRSSEWVAKNVGLSPASLGQFSVLASGVAKLVLILLAFSLIIAPFGVETFAFTDILQEVFTGIEIGGFSFSLTSVLLALALIGVGIVVTRGVQGWLENRYLPRTSIDTGLKSSISTGIGYVGVIAAIAIGLSSLGLNLENIALVAGALSVGIGFGLQSIVSNFVSGLILLAERPFKPGDWVVVGEEQGIVKRINVRSTEIQTFDRATVLIPNSDFIAGTVKNRVHRDTLGRIDVTVGVGYDSDPEKVRAILLEVAQAHPLTLSFPEPMVFFVDFGASSLDFILFAFLADVGQGYGVRSDLRFEIFKRFKEEGIEIPFAQSDVTIRNLDQIVEGLARAGVADAQRLGQMPPAAPTGQAGVSAVSAPPPASDKG